MKDTKIGEQTLANAHIKKVFTLCVGNGVDATWVALGSMSQRMFKYKWDQEKFPLYQLHSF